MPIDRYDKGKMDGERELLETLQAIGADWRTMPHMEFYKKWPNYREYVEVFLPINCPCEDCRLWGAGS